MHENPIVDWYKKDQKLCELLVAIDRQNLAEVEAACEAFYKVSELYNLPKFPEDVCKEDKLDGFGEECRNVSVYEQLAIVKRVHPENALRASVILAMLYVYKKFYAEINEAASEYYGTSNKIPETYYACFFGKDVDVKLKFYIQNKSAQATGARFIQLVSAEDE